MWLIGSCLYQGWARQEPGKRNWNRNHGIMTPIGLFSLAYALLDFLDTASLSGLSTPTSIDNQNAPPDMNTSLYGGGNSSVEAPSSRCESYAEVSITHEL